MFLLWCFFLLFRVNSLLSFTLNLDTFISDQARSDPDIRTYSSEEGEYVKTLRIVINISFVTHRVNNKKQKKLKYEQSKSRRYFLHLSLLHCSCSSREDDQSEKRQGTSASVARRKQRRCVGSWQPRARLWRLLRQWKTGEKEGKNITLTNGKNSILRLIRINPELKRAFNHRKTSKSLTG